MLFAPRLNRGRLTVTLRRRPPGAYDAPLIGRGSSGKGLRAGAPRVTSAAAIGPRAHRARPARHCRRPTGEDLPHHTGGRRHFVRARPGLGDRPPGRQRRRQDHHHRDDPGADHADLGQRQGAGRRDAAPALPGAAPDEFREPLRRHAAPADRAAEPDGVRPALPRRGARRPHRVAGRRSRPVRVHRPAGRQAVVRAENPRRARQGADQFAGRAAARRAHRLARPRHRRLGAEPARGLPRAGTTRRSCWPRTTWRRSSACASASSS